MSKKTFFGALKKLILTCANLILKLQGRAKKKYRILMKFTEMADFELKTHHMKFRAPTSKVLFLLQMCIFENDNFEVGAKNFIWSVFNLKSTISTNFIKIRYFFSPYFITSESSRHGSKLFFQFEIFWGVPWYLKGTFFEGSSMKKFILKNK